MKRNMDNNGTLSGNIQTVAESAGGDGKYKRSGQKTSPLRMAEIRQILRKGQEAGTHKEFLEVCLKLGEKLLREFFNDAIDLYEKQGSWAGDRKSQLDRYRQEILKDPDLECRSSDTLLKALYLASQDKWLEHKGIKGREKLNSLDKEALIQLEPGDRKAKLVENYLNGEQRLLEVLQVMIKHETYFGESWQNLTIDQLKKLLELHDVTLFLPETINKLVEICHDASPEDKDKLVELVLATYEYITKYLLGGISALYLTLGRLDLAKEVQNQQERMMDRGTTDHERAVMIRDPLSGHDPGHDHSAKSRGKIGRTERPESIPLT
ncbi:hypothetical protein [Desulfomonile tiedjei]|uniref:Uncharacterized protein n=1 Tax=Desulfomonile tiedjei (strain ATCC 49306 / DSM 6799 / DCB-1) TaxID=706587 RepID=I4C928_DESTA|nr:hypothetical protein [Desulfomonile tiedjei]AFM26069.1 hypothetical protein Desti_3415 [Desulfomonile tiedjei DSM 6799]